jgi:hypothetical protein
METSASRLLALDDADVAHAAHVGMRHLPRDADFVAEPRERGLVAARVQRDELQRDGLIERQVERAIDLAHAALAEQAENAEPAGEGRPGGEAAFFY